jgi:ABC-type branched-subunit amino acid transport system ATPase component/predicted MFS family arabinose efflux permease
VSSSAPGDHAAAARLATAVSDDGRASPHDTANDTANDTGDGTGDGTAGFELLSGGGDGPPTDLRRGLATSGGLFTFVVLLVLNSLDELEAATMTVLAPDIRDAFGVSDGVIVFISSASAAFFVLGAVPMGYLADRFRRPPIVGVASLVFSASVFLSGLATTAFMLFWTRFGAGVAKANTLAVHGSLLADAYPISLRGRIAATTSMVGRTVQAISPLVVGGLAALLGWRWPFLLLGLPVAIFGLLAFRIPEPTRGRWEKQSVLDEVIDDAEAAPISIEAAFARLMKIRTLRTIVIGFAALGFSLFTVPVLANLYIEDTFGANAVERGVVTSVAGFAGLLVLPYLGRRFDAQYRVDPALPLRTIGRCIVPMAVVTPLQFLMPNIVAFTLVGVVQSVLAVAAFSMVTPLIQAIVPYRLRGLGLALITLYIFLIGAIGGSLASAWLTDEFSTRTAVFVLAIPANLIGGALIVRSASFIRHDLALSVAELREEQADHRRRAADPEGVPVVQIHDVDVSFGNVQILFDVSFEVRRGETLALLGTNGAGKSTALAVVTGLLTPERGVVRLNGRTVTYTSPEQRARMGIQMLPGGKGVFPHLSVRDNLLVGAHQYRRRPAEVDQRIGRVIELFPSLGQRQDARAGDLSGGQQQMLALARVLLHDPEVLLIDELSLGLAPTVVGALLDIVAELKANGQTMIIVEQSLNVAMSIADRAVFMEKGRVRFEGSTAELAGRDDLVRAVFLGDGPTP